MNFFKKLFASKTTISPEIRGYSRVVEMTAGMVRDIP